LSMHAGYSMPAVITGKPVQIGGSLGRQEATGRGVTTIALKALNKLGIPPSDATVAVQGCGNVGWVSALLLAEAGARIVGISDVHGAIWKPDGFDIKDLGDHLARTDSITGYPGATPISNLELLTGDCTMLVPAALEGQITADVAREMRCTVVVEGANGPTLPDADLVLRDRGVMVVPDILANAGGVVVSYFEWVQALQAFFWEEADVNQRLEGLMRRAFDYVDAVAGEQLTTLRQAAYSIAVEKVANATTVRGIYP
ncbi:MAG: glutamate dehydrogenase, partial [Candidatus Dormibacteraeota bacterium]|nr:glutamate dehydrogenase [Candidatus Dormibacteraeota bacterium]